MKFSVSHHESENKQIACAKSLLNIVQEGEKSITEMFLLLFRFCIINKKNRLARARMCWFAVKGQGIYAKNKQHKS